MRQELLAVLEGDKREHLPKQHNGCVNDCYSKGKGTRESGVLGGGGVGGGGGGI